MHTTQHPLTNVRQSFELAKKSAAQPRRNEDIQVQKAKVLQHVKKVFKKSRPMSSQNGYLDYPSSEPTRIPTRQSVAPLAVTPFTPPTEAFAKLIQFDSMLFVKLRMVNKTFKAKTLESVDDLCNAVENSFVGAYYEHLFFKRSFTWHKPISFCREQGLRIDRVFECEVATRPGQTLTIACMYQLFGDSNTFRCEYKFDCVPQGKRQTWVHVDR